MFQFTTTNVINSNENDAKEVIIEALGANGKAGTDILGVKRVANFKKENIEYINKTVGKKAEEAKVTIILADPKPSKTFRLSLFIGLSEECQDSRYSNDFYKKGKSFTVEFPWLGTEQATVENLIKLVNKYQVFVFGEKLLKVSKTSGNHLAIEATNEYLRFVKVDLEKFVEPTAEKPMGDYEIVKSLDKGRGAQIPVNESKAGIADAEGVFVGTEGTGTYHFILHNLRIPTTMNTRAFGVKQDEAPIPGALYDEYVIHYCVDRGILGSNAVGDVVKSKTTHVLYVKLGSDAASALEAALNSLKFTTSTTVRGITTLTPAVEP